MATKCTSGQNCFERQSQCINTKGLGRRLRGSGHASIRTRVWIPSVHTAPRHGLCICSPGAEGGVDRQIPRACWPASLVDKGSAGSSERAGWKQLTWKVKDGDTRGWSLASTGARTGMSTPPHKGPVIKKI